MPDDYGWMLDLGRETHALCSVPAPYEPHAVLDLFERCVCFVSERGMIGGLEVPVLHGFTPSVNVAAFWDSADGRAWDLLEAHEDASDLPTAVSVVHENRRSRAIERALKMRGYEPAETLWVKRK